MTICHSRTRDLAAEVARADVLVAAVGVPGIVQPGMVKEGAAVIDVGITRTEDGLVGDVDPGVAERAGLLTPVPGGVGPMTIAMLLRSAVRAARYRRGACTSGDVRLWFARFIKVGGSVPGPSLHARRKTVGSGHRQVVLEREGLRLHRA